jgi:hypothetical protein
MLVKLTDVFATSSSPIATLITYLPVTSTMKLGRTCKTLYKVVGSCLLPSMVDELARKLRNLPSGQDFSLGWAPEKCRENRRFVMVAVQRDGTNYAHAGAFRKDTLIYKVALISATLFNPSEVKRLLEMADPDISCRPDVRAVLEAHFPTDRRGMWLKNGLCCLGGQEFFATDKELVLEAVQQAGWILEYASLELKADTEIVLAAIKQNGLALKSADRKLRADKKVVLVAVTQNGLALGYVDPELKADRDVVMAAVKQNREALKYAGPEFQAEQGRILAMDRSSKVIHT